MSLPINRIFPEIPDFEEVGDVKKYLQDLKFEMEDTYQNQTQNINGFFRNNSDVDGSQWIPTIEGTTTAGSPAYGRQIGYALRQGILTYCWFNIGWGALRGAAGNIRVNLPYKVTKSTGGNNFTGFAGSINLTWGGRTHLGSLALPDSYKLRLVAYGSGVDPADVPLIANAGVDGFIVYVGVEDE